MNLEQGLDKLNIQITYTTKSRLNNEYYIIIKKDNIETNYFVTTNYIEYDCSYIASCLINKIPMNIIEYKLGTTKANNIQGYTLNKPILYTLKSPHKIPKYSYFPKNREELYKLVRKLIGIRGNDCSLNDIDVSEITNMRYIFRNSQFNGDISKWSRIYGFYVL